ncbi:hypothetical protein L9F63_002596, partial [Diploptera punctata]
MLSSQLPQFLLVVTVLCSKFTYKQTDGCQYLILLIVINSIFYFILIPSFMAATTCLRAGTRTARRIAETPGYNIELRDFLILLNYNLHLIVDVKYKLR